MSNYGYLAHHGVKGQKWGVRHYQNPDGSLTAEGRIRYGVKDRSNPSIGSYFKDRAKIHRNVLEDTLREHKQSGVKGFIKNNSNPNAHVIRNKNIATDMALKGASNKEIRKALKESYKNTPDEHLNKVAAAGDKAYKEAIKNLNKKYKEEYGTKKVLANSALKALGSLTVAAAVLGGATIYNKGKNSSPSNDDIRDTINKSLESLSDIDVEEIARQDHEQNIKDFGPNYRDTKDWYRKNN